MTGLKAVFLDRDGTIGGDGHFRHPHDFELYPFSAEAIQLLKQAGLSVFAFTNQEDIAEGKARVEEFYEQFMAYGFDDAFICPHNGDTCECRKPRPGMLLEAAKRYNLDLTQCAVVGDIGATDMLAANAVGAKKILVQTGLGQKSLGKYRHLWAGVDPDYVADDVLSAVRWLLPLVG